MKKSVKIIKNMIQNQRDFFNTGKTRDISFRIRQLKAFEKAIKKNEDQIIEALKADLHKPVFEIYGGEIIQLLDEIRYAVKKVRKWANPKKVPTTIINTPGKCSIYPEPYGVVLLFGVWNYPVNLTLIPLVGAIAAGNCAIVKPSEVAVHTSSCIARIITDTFAQEYVTALEGGPDVCEDILAEKTDYIFYTGSTTIGRTIMEKAAKHLTPLTLELGGKNPCIVDKDVALSLAAKRIVWGKFYNAGQSCVAPDYVLAHNEIKDRLIQEMKKYIIRFYGDDPSLSVDYGRIINKRHFLRLILFLKQGDIRIGGTIDETGRYIAPTILDNVSWDDPVMEEEIFGPILPVVTFTDLSEAIIQITKRPKTLGLYIFTNNKRNQKRMLQEISFGGGCVNDTLVQFMGVHLPVGGIGSSGIGRYHGKASFDTFSHQKSLFRQSCVIDNPIRYPPYGDRHTLLKKLFV